MGDVNQFKYVAGLADRLDGPFLEVGSKDYGSTQDLRPLLAPKGRYVGIDMEAGDGVDLVLDLTGDFCDIDEQLDGQRFGTVICLSVLEHCAQPFLMAENITRLLAPGGKVCLSVPFAWKFHGYPSDYWRFTHEGVKKLFPALDFDAHPAQSATSRPNHFAPLDKNLGRISLSSSAQRKQGHPLRGVTAKLLQLGAKIGVLDWLADYPYLMAPTNVYMTGVLRPAAGRQAA